MSRQRPGRGEHKVFIGMAPGVGKTCRMLEEGAERLREGTDVMIGLLETHGRSETARLAQDLPRLERRSIQHHGVELQELDVDAALARQPDLLLVDELAHTTAPGSIHAKRWEDVEQILDSGISVYSTLNIQHLDSLHEVVKQLTGVAVQERLPDQVLQQANAVVLVDITPQTLEERLRDGKVYPLERVPLALSRFFQRDHLLALRELALREVANRVDDDLVQKQSSARERVLACFQLNRTGEQVLRRSIRLAKLMDAELITTHIQPLHQIISREQSLCLDHYKTICKDAGGEFVLLRDDDRLSSMTRLVLDRKITQVVIGQSMKPSWLHRLSPPLELKLQKRLRGRQVDLHVISTLGHEPGKSKPTSTRRHDDMTT